VLLLRQSSLAALSAAERESSRLPNVPSPSEIMFSLGPVIRNGRAAYQRGGLLGSGRRRSQGAGGAMHDDRQCGRP
jgi:hypothetical protein